MALEVTHPTSCLRHEIRRENVVRCDPCSPVAHGADEADRELSTRTGLSAVTLEPLRPRATHVVQLRSIAAVRQGASDGPHNGQEIHRLFPTPVSRSGYRPNFGQRMDVVRQ